ncbi:MAG: hypothetical protein GF308_01420 [Candidatus Heimdallarchaeota archaeon]|nr:hypothetical protein [Candidatus Heimdallarchaeota archaeon]
MPEVENSIDDSLRDNPVYLSKILLFANNLDEITERLRDFTNSTIQSSCLNTIGMFPLIMRIPTNLGTLCLSIWVINLHPRFNCFHEGYFTGASHAIIFQNEIANDQRLINILEKIPTSIPTTIVNEQTGEEEEIDHEEFLLPENFDEEQRIIIHRCFNDTTSLKEVFIEISHRLSEAMLSGNYQTYLPQCIKPQISHKTFKEEHYKELQKIVNKLGYKLDEDGVVRIPIDEFILAVDFYHNNITAIISECLHCDKKCQHSKKLCVVEEEKGYSNVCNPHYLRALAILYSIHEGKFLAMPGDKRREDINYQLKSLKKLFEANCYYHKTGEKKGLFRRLLND